MKLHLNMECQIQQRRGETQPCGRASLSTSLGFTRRLLHCMQKLLVSKIDSPNGSFRILFNGLCGSKENR